ncbi:MAG: hypothetical protein NW205_02125 [Hyphomicrobiaceae bacterium]|nr:hypothetical protein [Hyphomicrobiaceae bacterium]
MPSPAAPAQHIMSWPFVLLAVLLPAILTSPAKAQEDPLIAAQLAQAEGDLEGCAAKADVARRAPFNTYHAHRLFASCTAFAADVALKEGRLTRDAYAERLGTAIAALDTVLHTPGAQHQPGATGIIALTIEQLRAKVAAARQ